MKKAISILLILALLCALPLSAVAEEALPESEHPYARNCELTWTYEYPGEADGLYVTFSEDTYFSPGMFYEEYSEDFDEEAAAFFEENGGYYSQPDLFTIEYGEDDYLDVYYAYADSLAGKTIYVPRTRFTLTLHSNSLVPSYGFQITNIVPAYNAVVNYHLNEEETRTFAVPPDTVISLEKSLWMQQTGNEIIVGWQTADGARYYYENVTDSWRDLPMYTSTLTDITAENGATYDLYPITCPIALRADEVYSFINSRDVFTNEVDGYLFTKEHYVNMIKDWYSTFTFSPFMPLGAFGRIYETMYWPTSYWDGSCCGFPLTEILQHEGKIDMLSRQGVQTVSELEPDEELISFINFYNSQAVACHITNHMALDPGTADYTKELKALYETLEKGKPVYFEFYPGSQQPIKSILSGNPEDITAVHGILLTGAYTDGNGNHILIAHDNRSEAYSLGRCDIVYINEDFTEIYSMYYNDRWNNDDSPLNGFSWADDLTAYDSFKAEGVSNPFAWHIAFLRNCLSLFRQIFSLLKNMTGK